MSRRDYPNVGADLLAAVSACLAVLKTHLASDDPKVSLRAASELTKLLSVCARNGIELRKGEAPAEPRRSEPEASATVLPPVAPASEPVSDTAKRGSAGASTSQEPSVSSAGGGDDYAAQLNSPPVIAPSEPARKIPSLTLPARKEPHAPASGKPRLTSFLGRADPVSQPQRPARPLALPD